MTNLDLHLDLPDLSLATLWAILEDTLDDATVNGLVWFHLGYRPGEPQQPWHATDAVPPSWREKYPTAPDFIASRPATVQLTRSIPKEHKQLLKTYLGFKGYTVDQLVPRLTRRATMVNWLLSHWASQGELPPHDPPTPG